MSSRELLNHRSDSARSLLANAHRYWHSSSCRTSAAPGYQRRGVEELRRPLAQLCCHFNCGRKSETSRVAAQLVMDRQAEAVLSQERRNTVSNPFAQLLRSVIR